MTRQRKFLILGVLIIIALMLATAAAIWKRKDGKKPLNPVASELVAKQAQQALRFGPMDWVTVKPTLLASYVPLTGSVRAVDSATVKAKVAGELRSLSVREGMAVNKGDVVGQIDTTDYQLRIQERQAQLRQAEAQLLTAQLNADANQQLVARGFISENSSANTVSALDAAKAARDTVQFQLDQALKALGDTRLIAPISGMVAERYALPG
ncbi:MAG: efflux RND transporter periplasmic adaptor subunit, partial [Burkholderiales bacterium]